ncbi:aminoacyl-tRNA hydrolase [Candidatus Erwinia haradaeae]|uniref:Peptidyl-tRNA hydrolase n=1 Tax=Candidatus Erwinia haradaeae TaxID=1922217 RepID=A0A451DA31_9GAMM|nr:aminoacyl-tRNA hydrolase [Candidatus Erwinia haradaeae]VFP83206.1 Peptidyl-tRNA hydrolase [Candidatus Erwinia haradaeae]
MSCIKLIVGLANPGEKYTTTRHNAGAWYVYMLAQHYNQILIEEKKFFGYTACLKIGTYDIRLLTPTTFMNHSGKSVASMAMFYKIPAQEILIAHDELHLPPGVVKLKQNGSHGGHNGLKDIIKSLGNDASFHRLRIGIGHPENRNKVVEFVLGTPLESEQQCINNAIDRAIYCTEIWFKENRLKGINQLHSMQKNKGNTSNS